MPPQETLLSAEAQRESLREPLVTSAQNDEPETDRSPNIRWILSYTLFAFAGRAIWYQSVLSTYCYLLQNDNPESVGFITSVMGICQLLASIPTGVVADRWSPSHGRRRDLLLRIAAVIGLTAVGMTSFSVYRESYMLLASALALWGVVYGVVNTALTAMFADSIDNGERSKYFTQRSILIKLGNTMGPAVSLILFAFLGDKWSIRDCSIVMVVGQVICLPSMVLLCCPSDKHVVLPVDSREESSCEPNDTMDVVSPSNTFLTTHVDMNTIDDSPPLLLLPSPNSPESNVMEDDDFMACCESGGDKIDSSFLISSIPGESQSEGLHEERGSFCFCQGRMIPILVAVADIISGLASGMSIRYFPIFFYENLRLGPVIVQVLGIACPLAGTMLSHFAQHWSLKIGPCRMACIYKWIGLACMVSMIASYKLSWPTWCTCVLYVLRTSFMNSTSALTKSVMMDSVPSSERGKWSALESVNMFSWSGSAALGGIMVGLNGILFNFCITASLQFVATMPLVVLFTRFERQDRNEEPQGATSDCASASDNCADEGPLFPHFTNDDRFRVYRPSAST